MLMEGTEQGTSSSNNEQKFVFQVYNDPVMKVAIEVLERLGNLSRLTLKAKGRSIPNAVAVANIITEKMMKGTSAVEKISVDSENTKELGRMLSTIEIILVKKF